MSAFQAGRDIDQALVCTAAENNLITFQFVQKRSVYQHIKPGKYPDGVIPGCALLDLFPGPAGIEPEIYAMFMQLPDNLTAGLRLHQRVSA